MQGQLARAARLLAAAQALRQQIGAPLPPSRRAEYDCSWSAARLGLEPAADTVAGERAPTLEQAIADALNEDL